MQCDSLIRVCLSQSLSQCGKSCAFNTYISGFRILWPFNQSPLHLSKFMWQRIPTSSTTPTQAMNLWEHGRDATQQKSFQRSKHLR